MEADDRTMINPKDYVDVSKQDPYYAKVVDDMAKQIADEEDNLILKGLDEYTELQDMPDEELPLHINREWILDSVDDMYKERLASAGRLSTDG